MSLSAAFNIISSSFAANAAQTAVVSNNIANANTPGYSREIANVVTNSYGGADVASVTRVANAALAEQVSTSTAAGRRAAGDLQRPRDARRHGRRQRLGFVGLRREPERRLAFGDARQSAKRADDLRGFADVFLGGRRRSHGRVAARRLAQQRRRGGRSGARAGRPGHGLVGRDDQFAARPVHCGQQFGRDRPRDRRQCRERRGYARFARDPALAANRRHDDDRRQRIDVDLYRQRRDAFPGRAAHGRLSPRRRPSSTASAAPPSPSTACRSRVRIRRCRSSRARSRAMRRSATRSRRNTRPNSTRSRAGSSTLSPKAISRRRRRCPRCPASSPRRARRACPRRRRRPASPPRSRSTRTPIPRRAGTRRCCATAAFRAPATQPTPTIRPGRRATPGGSSSSSARSARPRVSTRPPASALRRASPITPTPRSAGSRRENQQASNASAYQSALATQATSALSNATGVNLDAEMTNMLNLENSYASSAKLLTTVNSMFSALLDAA